MKTRKGFVSNSSSSSFLVAFKEKPKTRTALQKMLGHDPFYPNPFYDAEWCPVPGWTAFEVAQRVWIDLVSTTSPMSKEDIIDVLNESWFDEVDSYERIRKIIYSGKQTERHEREAYWQRRREQIEDYVEYWLSCPKIEGAEIYHFEYSDNDGAFYSALEHGGLFKNIPHLVASHH